jgi:uncharacterized protein (TIGR04255 family)
MSADQKFKIDISEKFPHLPRAPIVEAIIEIRARAEGAWEEAAVRTHFEPKLSGYSYLDAQRIVEHQVQIQAGQAPKQLVRELGLKGVRFRSVDNRHIVQLNRNGLAFSRLQPYEDWGQLSSQAMRLWRTYLEFARVTEIERLGVRFINRIQLPPQEVEFEDYIRPGPQPPHGIELPFAGFMHYDTLTIPGYLYAINVIRTIQTPVDIQTHGLALILDIDAFTTQPFELSNGAIEQRLPEMRWLKNKVFLGSVTEKALKGFR